MPSIYQHAMGNDFGKLHPKIRERFGFTSEQRRACIGSGVMHKMWRGPCTYPFLRIGRTRSILFPETRDATPFTILNYAYKDPFGRETVTWIRNFDLPKVPRRFDSYMIFSQSRGTIVDYLGTHQHLAVDLRLSAGPRGGIQIESGDQRFYERFLAFRWPAWLTGIARVCESFDESIEKFRITVDVRHRGLGQLFGYEGTFTATWIDAPAAPPEVLPRRHERRE
jgi:hypothetical protein